MRNLIESRIAVLHEEFEAGQRLQVELDARQEDLRRTMLRISGALQVLQELLQHEAAQGSDDVGEEATSGGEGPARRVAAG